MWKTRELSVTNSAYLFSTYELLCKFFLTSVSASTIRHGDKATLVTIIGGELMNATELIYFKAYLLEQKSSILNKTVEFKHQQLHSDGNVSDEAEAASKDLSTNLSIHLHERDRNALFAIEKALSKLSDGTYGLCELCHDTIEVRRLKARPFASMCIQCMEEQEDPRNLLN